MLSCCVLLHEELYLPTWMLLLKDLSRRAVKDRDAHTDRVGPDPFSLTLAVHVSFLIPEGIIWTV